MKVTFPHMGNVYIAAKALLRGLEIECIVPPMSSKTSIEIGSLYAPEEMCYPFKINLGNYIQSIEMGADTVIITGSCGPCRFGEYCELQMKTLRKLGYNVDFIVIDVPSDIGMEEFLKRLGKISSSSTVSRGQKIKALYDAIKIINLIDSLEARVRYLAGYEINKGEFKRLFAKCKSDALNCDSPSETINVLNEYKRKVSEVKIDKNIKPIKIGIIGEIYTILEPFSNLYIEDKLMDYGVSSFRKLTPSWWVKNMVMSPFKLNSPDLKRASKKYLPLCIGGHARECIGEAVLAKENGYDGAIQIFPMGCMPEIVSKSILPTISKDMDIPIMTLVVDEMTGEAGYVTRVEAFIDLLERRRRNVLSRH